MMKTGGLKPTRPGYYKKVFIEPDSVWKIYANTDACWSSWSNSVACAAKMSTYESVQYASEIKHSHDKKPRTPFEDLTWKLR